jgi:farnesyl diphosphate synthase
MDETLMGDFGDRLAGHAARCDEMLADLLNEQRGVPARLAEAMRLAVMGGGKRFRPFLVIESARLFGVPETQAVRAAAALELTHCYSLVHDDLPAMDNDQMRRGQPTVWAAFDEWTAILVGDALLTLTFEVIADDRTHEIAEVRGALTAALAKAAGAGGMVGGQMLDLMADKRGEPPQPTLDHVRRLQAMKTGALIRFAAEAGALLGRATPDAQTALRAYGDKLGVVFQIADDLLDATGDSETVGKATGKDTAAGKATQVSLMGLEAARETLDALAEAAIADLAPFGDAGHVLADAVRFAANRKR